MAVVEADTVAAVKVITDPAAAVNFSTGQVQALAPEEEIILMDQILAEEATVMEQILAEVMAAVADHHLMEAMAAVKDDTVAAVREEATDPEVPEEADIAVEVLLEADIK